MIDEQKIAALLLPIYENILELQIQRIALHTELQACVEASKSAAPKFYEVYQRHMEMTEQFQDQVIERIHQTFEPGIQQLKAGRLPT